MGCFKPFTSEPSAENSALYTMSLAAGQRGRKDRWTGVIYQRLFPNRGLEQGRRGPSPEALYLLSTCGASSLKLNPAQVSYQTGRVGEKSGLSLLRTPD